MFNLVIIAIAVSIDGFWGGFAFGMQKIKTTFSSMLIIAACTIICTLCTMSCGHYLQNLIAPQTCKVIGAVLLCLIGCLALINGKKKHAELKNEQTKPGYNLNDLLRVIDNPLLADADQNKHIKWTEALLLGMAFALDGSVAAFTFSLAGYNPLTIPFLFGIIQSTLIGLGNLIAIAKVSEHIEGKYMMIPGAILVILGLARLF